MSHDWIGLALALGGGAVLGALYFASLWLTVDSLPRARRPMLMLALSMVVRVTALCAGLYVISGGQWAELVAALIGVLVTRVVATVVASPPGASDGGGKATER